MERHPPYRRITRRGVDLDWRTWGGILEAERRARFQFTITQGSYNGGGVDASAGTHDGGGVVDLSVRSLTAADRARMVRALRNTGWAAWLRPAIDGVWGEHVHAVLGAHQSAAPLAKRQWDEYLAGGDGLVGSAPDPHAYRPDPVPVFDYQAWQTGRVLAHRIADLRGRLANLVRRRKAIDVTH